MKRFLILLFCINVITLCFGHSTPKDSLSIKPEKKIRFKLYLMPTFSYNTGSKFAPGEQFNSSYMYGSDENGNLGGAVGIDVEWIISDEISLSSGIYLECFRYKGTGSTTLGYGLPPPSVSFMYSYTYLDGYLSIPLLVNLPVMKRNNAEVKFFFGGSGGAFLFEKSSLSFQSIRTSDMEENSKSVFLIVGIDYFRGKNHRINLGLRYTSQMMTPTPRRRMFASIGLKIGTYF